jgi:signal transduction histidine kinase
LLVEQGVVRGDGAPLIGEDLGVLAEEQAALRRVATLVARAAKHAHASVVNVELDADDASLRLAIRDDGIGGADPGRGSGLVGLSDRVEALGGTLQVSSPAGTGTTLLIEVPLEGQRGAV